MVNEIKEIKSLIIQANKTTVIADLIDINMRITGLMVYFIESEGKLLKEKLSAYNERKMAQARLCIESDEGITKAEKSAILKTKDLQDKELQTEVEYQAARSFRMQVSEFCQALVQKIANLRSEQSQTKYQHG